MKMDRLKVYFYCSLLCYFFIKILNVQTPTVIVSSIHMSVFGPMCRIVISVISVGDVTAKQ